MGDWYLGIIGVLWFKEIPNMYAQLAPRQQHSSSLVVRRFVAFSALLLVSVFAIQPERMQAAEAAVAANLEAADSEVDFENLLGENAQRLWRGYKDKEWPSGWELKDGVLSRVGGGDDIMTVGEFADFDLRLEWKISEAGNSGIIYRVSTGDNASYVTGIECQVLDDDKHRDGKNALTSAASLYALYPRSERTTVPVGEWNKARIVVRGNHVEHWLNGKKVVECEIGSDDWKERLAKSKFADWPKFAKNRKGHIALQDHSDPVWYRNIRIKRLVQSE